LSEASKSETVIGLEKIHMIPKVNQSSFLYPCREYYDYETFPTP